MDVNILDPRLAPGIGGAAGYVPTDPTALNKISQAGGLPTWNGGVWPGGATSGGDMYKSVYDPDGDGKFAMNVLPAPGTVSGTFAAGNDSRFHTHLNKTAALDFIGNVGGLPTWNGGAWPSSATDIPGQVSSLSYSYTYGIGTMAAPQALKLVGGIAAVNNNATVTGAGSQHILAVVRDLRAATDTGTAGFTNCGLFAHTVTKIGTQNAFEWNALFILDQMSDGPGEHCAIYTQANKYGTAGAWGGCFQVVDYRDDAENDQLIWGAEFDCAVSGYRTNGMGITVICQDAKAVTGRGTSVDKRAAIGIAVAATGGSKWVLGQRITDYCDEGMLIYPGPTYDYTGLDAQSAIRIQGKHRGPLVNVRYAEATKGISFTEFNTFSTGLAIDIGLAHGYGVAGQKVVGKRMPKWGYAIAANIADDQAGGDAFYRWDPNTDFEFLANQVAAYTTVAQVAFMQAIMVKAWGALVTDLRHEYGHGLLGS